MLRVNLCHGPARRLDDANLTITAYAILRLEAAIDARGGCGKGCLDHEA